MMMVKDEWMQVAMADDELVVELLFRLKQSQAASPLKFQPQLPMLLLSWSVRLPKSRALKCDSTISQRKQADSAKCSPTTPLSWSGATSHSATANGFEESSYFTSLQIQGHTSWIFVQEAFNLEKGNINPFRLQKRMSRVKVAESTFSNVKIEYAS